MNAVSSSPMWDSSPTIAKSAVRHGKESLTKPSVRADPTSVKKAANWFEFQVHGCLMWGPPGGNGYPAGEFTRGPVRGRIRMEIEMNKHCSHCMEYDVIGKAGDKIGAMITFLENQKALNRIASHGVALNDLHEAPGGTHASSVVQLIGCRSCW
ncbi:hypothetical protein MGG_15521 [Pyricularia oryzae 70-15]|uniref:Uncharacterized protein n=2 Tax=Pyricularia oryzae TaxID=318829 RepID=G4MYF1_PYRO7|nr:uncharacterized protein MGG_15521 [Pyricularia oryzae 70-15]EHA53571.1 hypothetical protein MGG_15521 [Pyricularia oryzae 70-15]ELQ38687.1 hypothetical protein OOU_Y34scaffold00531g5 [Pyricularia oryzae Y34]